MSQSLPLSLYIHLPWCVRKCPYCDFNSHEAKNTIPEDDYVNALLADLNDECADAGDRKLTSIFFGGGTPSLFSAEAIDRVLNHASKTIGFAPNIEITLEANPGTVEQTKFNGYRAAGVNRLSIGVQSFDPEMLNKLGRIHSRDEALRAREAAANAGIDNVNLDLMYGLPNQTVEQAIADLATAIDLAPTHLSQYQLTLEPNTPFYRQPPTLPNDDLTFAMQQQSEQLLATHGFEQYETSAYATAGRRCQHNLNYWGFGDYIGIGAGAHGKLTLPDGSIQRRWKHKHPKIYQAAQSAHARIAGQNAIEQADLIFEFMMNALRLNEGFTPEAFTQRTGLPLQTAETTLRKAQEQGLLDISTQRIRPTPHGRLFLNTLLEMFLAEGAPHDDKRSDSRP